MLHNLYTAANPLHANRQPPATPTAGDGMDAETAPDDEYVPTEYVCTGGVAHSSVYIPGHELCMSCDMLQVPAGGCWQVSK